MEVDFELKQTIVLQTIAKQKSIKLTSYFTEAEAAKISFDNINPKENNVAGSKDKQADAIPKKVIKPKKARRTAEESQKDAADLKTALSLYNQSIYQEAALVYENLNHVIDLPALDSYNYTLCFIFFCNK